MEETWRIVVVSHQRRRHGSVILTWQLHYTGIICPFRLETEISNKVTFIKTQIFLQLDIIININKLNEVVIITN